MSNIYKLLLFMAAMVVIVCGPVWAHNVSVFAWVEGDTVHVEGKFGGGRKVVNARVEVYDPEDNLLLTGVTDENGEFTFKIPRKTEIKVVLLAGMGHRGEWTIPLSEVEAMSSGEVSETIVPGAISDLETTDSGEVRRTAASGSRQTAAPEPAAATGNVAATGSPRASSGYVTAAEMKKAIEVALDKKLKPMMRLLVDEKQSGPSVTDIFGGIGYIFGLVGVAAYITSRRRKT